MFVRNKVCSEGILIFPRSRMGRCASNPWKLSCTSCHEAVLSWFRGRPVLRLALFPLTAPSAADRPSRHPLRERTLTPHEAARIQFFPDFFDFGDRARTDLIQAIGNATVNEGKKRSGANRTEYEVFVQVWTHAVELYEYAEA